MDLFDGLPDPSSSSANASKLSSSSGSTVLSGSGLPHSLLGAGVAKRKQSDDYSEDNPVKMLAGNVGQEKEPRCADTSSSLSDQPHVTDDAVLQLKGFRVELQGERDDMEDHSVISDQFTDDRLFCRSDIKRLAYYGVFDGHNGRRASKLMEQEMKEHILSAFSSRGGATAKDLDEAIIGSVIAAFKSADSAFLSKAAKQKPPWKDGTTATTALIVNNKAYLANVGDSKAVVCRFDRARNEHKIITLTVDHTPLLYEERQRIQQQGGSVREGRLNGVLEVSRSLGDLPYKKNTGLSCVPSVHKYQLNQDDRFLIIACDGLWKALSPFDAMKLVLSLVQQNSTKEELDGKYNGACMALAKESVKRLSGDNVTVLLIRIGA